MSFTHPGSHKENTSIYLLLKGRGMIRGSSVLCQN